MLRIPTRRGLRMTINEMVIVLGCVVLVEFVELDDADQPIGILRMGGITCRLQSTCPTLIVSGLQLEKRLIALPTCEELRMIFVGVIDTVVGAETLATLIIIMIGTLTRPPVTLDAEMVVAFPRQVTLTSPTLKQSLCQGNGSRNMITLHLADGYVLILVDILLICLIPSHLPMCQKGDSEGGANKKLPHNSNFCAKVMNSLDLFVNLQKILPSMKELELKSVIQECQLDELTAEEQQLIGLAIEATDRSYAPYSHFHVGAAVRLDNGEEIIGCNQENAAYPSGLCAERTALFTAGAQYPDTPVRMLAIAARGTDGELTDNPTGPCGSCRQVIIESETRAKHPIRILLYGQRCVYVIDGIRKLMPLTFSEF